MSDSSFDVPEEIKYNPEMDSNLVVPVPLTPLTERLAQGKPHLLEGLTQLKTRMREEDFTHYIERLTALKIAGETLWLTTNQQMDRSVLERNYLPALKEAFAVKYVRIICL